MKRIVRPRAAKGLPDADSSVVLLSRVYNKFGLNLLRETAVRDIRHNCFLSPLITAIGLNMLQVGARGRTADELAKVLGTELFDSVVIRHGNEALSRFLSFNSSALQILSATRIWMSNQFRIRPEFATAMDRSYQANPVSADFADPKTVAEVNAWVSEKTKGHISGILDNLSPRDMMVLATALYFKGSWMHEFEPKETKEQPFHLLSGDSMQVPMMRRQGDYYYFETSELQGIKLPYIDPQWSGGDGRI